MMGHVQTEAEGSAPAFSHEKAAADIEKYLNDHTDDMVRDIMHLMRIDSARGEAMPGKPYGEGPSRALARGADLMRQYGLTVKDFENRVVTGDLTDKGRHLDILAHLDVVPGGADWTICEPFAPVLLDGILYGRGASDDKGPAVAALYAMRAVRDCGVPLTRNVRLILGSDEECGSSDIAAYYQVEPEAPMTFSPDANWPVVNTEKGRLTCTLRAEWPLISEGPRILSAQAGEKENVVPGKAHAMVAGLTAGQVLSCVETLEKDDALRGIHFSVVRTETGESGVTAQSGVSAQCLLIEAKGVPCHAAMPQSGANALTGLVRLLSVLPVRPSPAVAALVTLAALFPHDDTDGSAMGLRVSDALSGTLTVAFSILRLSETGFYGTLDCRVPVCGEETVMKRRFDEAFGDTTITLSAWSWHPPHHVPADSPFIRSLLESYAQVMGKTGQPISIGGGTYVHSLRNGVAFGCEEEGADRKIHGPDEFAVLSELVTSARIFAEAIVRLCGPEVT